jgi:hypothetical protein
MGMTVDSMAAAYYSQYNLANSQGSGQNAVDPSDISENNYGISNLSNALDMLSNTENASPYISNLDQYVQSSYAFSQLPEYDAMSAMNDKTGNALYGYGNVNDAVSMNYMANELGLGSDSINPNGVTDPAAAARMALLKSGLSVSSSPVDLYQNELDQNLLGSGLDIAG